ncbi:MAG: hypothetical protein ACJAZK_000277 [Psychroserpens sp.]|jgi:hypothetical protein|uniref:hypothetical protein n=1 Tax=Psychroserpens sp. TaxID=2020870 RepID=UPI0039E6CB98
MIVYISLDISYNTQFCRVFNTDNIELRTDVNSPEVVSIDCPCKDNKKISKFIIDSQLVDLNDYISRNEFTLIDDLYIKENNNRNSRYKVVFDTKTTELTVNLTYK